MKCTVSRKTRRTNERVKKRSLNIEKTVIGDPGSMCKKWTIRNMKRVTSPKHHIARFSISIKSINKATVG